MSSCRATNAKENRARWLEHARFLSNAHDCAVEAEDLIRSATTMVATARQMAGVACDRCGGHGLRAYGSTSTWRGGGGGQAFTTDVCDLCWGSGRNDHLFGDQRLVLAALRKAGVQPARPPVG